MRLILLTCLTMVAFAANSVLNRLALIDPAMGPAAFAAIRLVAGALALTALVWLRKGGGGLRPTIAGTGGLALYVIGFSFAYVTLDAGAGALILFGGVQVTMFAGAVLAREPLPVSRWLGAAVAFLGLVYLLWPTGTGTGAAGTGTGATDIAGALLMTAAAIGWGIYSLIGRKATDPLGATAGNFLVAAPLGVVLWAVMPDGITLQGVVLASVSGVVTSGLGYALWYSVLPRLQVSVAAVAQLTVPVIALAGGAVFLGETLTVTFVVASVLVLGGVLISLLPGAKAPR